MEREANMDKKDLKLVKNLSIWGAVFVIVVGTLLHFCYEWSGNNFIIGLFAPVNESPWEHMKLAFMPIILFGFVDFYFLKINPDRPKGVERIFPLCFALVKEIGVSIAFILAVFYTYTSLTGNSILAIDISSFIIGIILAKWFGYLILTDRFKNWEFKGLNTLSALLLVIITAFFVIATLNPPRTNLFQDPVSGTYGINELF
jgi:hypothetical protein